MYEYSSGIPARRYRLWGFLRFVKRLTAYLLIMPVMLALYPFTAAGNWLGAVFYKLRGW